MKILMAAGIVIAVMGLTGCVQPTQSLVTPSIYTSTPVVPTYLPETEQPKKALFPEGEVARKSFFMKEKHDIYAKCGVLGSLIFTTGPKGTVYFAGEGQLMTEKKYANGIYSFVFNGGSLLAMIIPDSELMGIKSHTGLVNCHKLAIVDK
ncbi:hypothetical protein FQW43_27395 [Salmonella enterica subsp. enterica serovar Enteritidis]|nr:hypothetical protein [Salmonella enterica subsp. enterica serovar Enteritidis]